VDEAHRLGMTVLLDVVHSHASKVVALILYISMMTTYCSSSYCMETYFMAGTYLGLLTVYCNGSRKICLN
jgi:hypothetical protein